MIQERHEAVSLYARLFINAALGENDEAFKALSRTTETHSWPMMIKTLPIFAGLRKDPRFADFCLKVGIHP
jgi:hypothetical protein